MAENKHYEMFFSLSGNGENQKEDIPLVHDALIEEQYDSDIDVVLLHREITKLPRKLKSVLILYSLEENSQADCSEILGISSKAIETRVYRAKKILEKKLAKHFEGYS